jgi:hypothetical protein
METVDVRNPAQACFPARTKVEEPMKLKIVLTAAMIALCFLSLGEQSVVQTAVAAEMATLSAATKKKPAVSRQREPNQVACTELGMPSNSTRLPPANGLHLGWNADRFRYGRLSVRASPLKSGVNFRRFQG